MARLGRTSRWVLMVGTVAGIASIGAAGASSPSTRPPAPLSAPLNVSAIGPAGAAHPSVSGDGQYVVFEAPSADGQRDRSAFLRDRAKGLDVELSLPVTGQALGDTVWPTISADGCFVVVITELPFDLFRDEDTGSRWDVYRLRLPACDGQPNDWELVSAVKSLSGGTAAADNVVPTYPPAVSGTAGVIAYTHQFGADLMGVSVADLTVPLGQPGRLRPVAGSPSIEPASAYLYRGIRQPAISDDGEVVAYVSDATSASPVAEWPAGDAEGTYVRSHVFAWTRWQTDLTLAVANVSAPAGATATGDAAAPSVNASGRYVAFTSNDPALANGAALPPCVPACVPQVYRFDLDTGSRVLVSAAALPDGAPADAIAPAANAAATQPTISADGGEVAYVTRATNLFATRAPGAGGASDGEIVLADLVGGEVRRLSVRSDGTAAPAAHSSPRFSSNGRVVVFDSLAASSFGVGQSAGRQIVALTSAPTLLADDLDWGTTRVGFLGAERFTTVINQGPGSFTPAVIATDNPDFVVNELSSTCQVGTPVPAGSSCTILVLVTPSVPGRIEATLSVTEFGFNAVGLDIALSAEGGEPEINVDGTASAGYDPQQVGTVSVARQFTVRNDGLANPTTIAAVSVGGAHPDDFSVSATTCLQNTLQPEQTCTVDVVFNPTAAGERRAMILVRSSLGAYTPITVSGRGFFAPSVGVDTTIIRSGREFVMVGNGFAPSTPLTLVFADGHGLRLTVVTDGDGAFTVPIILDDNERAGRRTLVAQSASGDAASVGVRVLVPNRSSDD